MAAALSVDGALEKLNRARESNQAASQMREDAQNMMSDLKDAVDTRQSAVDKLTASISGKSSLDEKWEHFKSLFDKLNTAFVEHLKDSMGCQAAAQRPAEMISETRVAQVLRKAKRIVVLTGAGISAESGVPTFRGSDGYWTVGSENYRPQELATWEKFNEMPLELWKWYQYRWATCTRAKPNPGHYALVELDGLIDGGVQLVTQNIDGLHLQAGSDASRLCEIHGRIDEMRCDERVEGSCLHNIDFRDPGSFELIRSTVQKTPKAAKSEDDERVPVCGKCGVRQRPKILWFDESYNEPLFEYNTTMEATKECDVLLIVGTQLTTGLPSSMVTTARKNGSIIIKMDTLVDLDDPKCAGMLHVQAKSGEALPRIVAELKNLLKEPLHPPLAVVRPSSPVAAPASGRKPATPPSPALRTPVVPAPKKRSSSSSAAWPLKAESMPRRPSKGALGTAASMSLSRKSPFGVQQASNVSAAKVLSRIASHGPGDSSSPVGFFVYGTLRPDDDSGASWTQDFSKGLVGEPALLPGASLYVDGSYPAVCFEETRCTVRGVLLTPSDASILAPKLADADRIEGFPDLYQRTVAMVRTLSGDERHAYVYHRTGRFDRATRTCIPDGDWMSRRR